MHYLFNPGKVARFITHLMPWCAGLTIALFAAGLYRAFFDSPADYQQGDAVRIMYIHVPAAWMSLMIYTMMALSSAASLIWKNPLSDIMAKAAAPIGAAFTLVTLVTGSLWGKPIWGTWWVWDARLTSVLILFFFYLGYMALVFSREETERTSRAAAILALVGFINIPIVKFSVDFWNTLHQPASILRGNGPAIHISMLIPLLLMMGGCFFFFLTTLGLRIKTEIALRKIARLQRSFF